MILEVPDSGNPCEETILIADSGLGSRTIFPSESEFLFLENLDSDEVRTGDSWSWQADVKSALAFHFMQGRICWLLFGSWHPFKPKFYHLNSHTSAGDGIQRGLTILVTTSDLSLCFPSIRSSTYNLSFSFSRKGEGTHELVQGSSGVSLATSQCCYEICLTLGSSLEDTTFVEESGQNIRFLNKNPVWIRILFK